MNKQELKNLLVEYLIETTKEVKKIAAGEGGRQVLGETINRPEDLEIGIDRVGEDILEKLLKEHKIKATIFSEPENRDIKNGGEVYGSVDPFDGSMLYLRGFEHSWYTALSFFDKDRNPIWCGIADIINEKYYITEKDGNYLISMKTGERKKIQPATRKKLTEPIVLSSYIMSSQYSPKFLDIFGDLVRNMHPKGLFYPHGGSYIYAFLASGLIDAYIMFNEPRSEIDPGFPIARKAGCQVVSVDSDGKYQDYQFLPGRQHDKVDLLIAAPNLEIRDQLIKRYVEKYEQKYSL